jgi:hypothetical protein
VNPYCSHCGFLLEPDCDFCPSCGSAKAKSQQSSSNARDAYAWMKDPTPAPQPVPSPPVEPSHSRPLVQASVPAPQIQYVTYQVQTPASQSENTGLGTTVRTLGVTALSFMLVGLIPCLGWLNYITILLSFVTIILGIVAIATAKSATDRTSAILGVVFVVLAVVLGGGRLLLGGGCI